MRVKNLFGFFCSGFSLLIGDIFVGDVFVGDVVGDVVVGDVVVVRGVVVRGVVVVFELSSCSSCFSFSFRSLFPTLSFFSLLSFFFSPFLSLFISLFSGRGEIEVLKVEREFLDATLFFLDSFSFFPFLVLEEAEREEEEEEE